MRLPFSPTLLPAPLVVTVIPPLSALTLPDRVVPPVEMEVVEPAVIAPDCAMRPPARKFTNWPVGADTVPFIMRLLPAPVVVTATPPLTALMVLPNRVAAPAEDNVTDPAVIVP